MTRFALEVIPSRLYNCAACVAVILYAVWLTDGVQFSVIFAPLIDADVMTGIVGNACGVALFEDDEFPEGPTEFVAFTTNV
jgi:hypothetical protein